MKYLVICDFLWRATGGLRMQCRAWRAPTSSRTALLMTKQGMHVWSTGFHESAGRVRTVMFRDRGTGEVPGVHQADQLTTTSAYSKGVAGPQPIRHESNVDTEALRTKRWPVETGICKWVIPSPATAPNQDRLEVAPVISLEEIFVCCRQDCRPDSNLAQ